MNDIGWTFFYMVVLFGAFFFTCHWFGKLCERGQWMAFWFWVANFAFICYMATGR